MLSSLQQIGMSWFVISGAPRSGTTGLQRLVNTHPFVGCFHEYDLPAMFSKIDSFFDVEAVQSKIRTNQDNTSDDSAFPLLRRLKHRDHVVSMLLGALFENKPLQAVGDKMPNLTTMGEVDRILHFEPTARFIYLVRNPMRVVASSLRRAALAEANKDVWHIRTIEQAIEEWWKNFKHAQAEYKREGVLIMKYESLLDDYAAQSDRLAAFLGVSNKFRNVMLDTPQEFVLTPRQQEELTDCMGSIAERWDEMSLDDLLTKEKEAIFLREGEKATPISGSPYVAILAGGFSAPEDWGTWTDSSKSHLAFRIPRRLVGHPIHVTLKVRPFDNGAPEEKAIIHTDGFCEMFSIARSRDGVQRLDFQIVPARTKVELHIIVTDPKGDMDEPRSDPRKLGLALYSLSYIELPMGAVLKPTQE